jgi:hypothetical protein
MLVQEHQYLVLPSWGQMLRPLGTEHYPRNILLVQDLLFDTAEWPASNQGLIPLVDFDLRLLEFQFLE